MTICYRAGTPGTAFLPGPENVNRFSTGVRWTCRTRLVEQGPSLFHPAPSRPIRQVDTETAAEFSNLALVVYSEFAALRQLIESVLFREIDIAGRD